MFTQLSLDSFRIMTISVVTILAIYCIILSRAQVNGWDVMENTADVHILTGTGANSSVPTGVPSSSPSKSPTPAPTISFVPTVSFAPTYEDTMSPTSISGGEIAAAVIFSFIGCFCLLYVVRRVCCTYDNSDNNAEDYDSDNEEIVAKHEEAVSV